MIDVAPQEKDKICLGVLSRVVGCTVGCVHLCSSGSLLQGEWKPRQIDNPDYKRVLTLFCDPENGSDFSSLAVLLQDKS